MTDQINRKGLLAWFAQNHVASNLLMLLIIASGIISILTMLVEFFPEMSLDIITVTVPYRGASPSEVELGATLRVEEAIASVDGIKRMTSTSAEGASMVMLEVEEYADVSEVLDDVKAEVDRIITFPQETEKPIISEIKTRYEVLTIVLHGDASEKSLKELGEQIKDDLTSMGNISQVDVTGIRSYEISIEVPEENLRKYSLSFDQVTSAVRNSSLDIPGGSVKTVGGEILVRTKGQKYRGPEFEEIVVLTRKDGTKIRLRDIANVIDGFDESDIATRFDGKPAVQVKVFRVGQQDALDVADTANQYVINKREELPDSLNIDVWQDQSIILRQRIDLLQRNGIIGLCLVFLCLTIFLDLKLAFWTTMGIPISFLGAFWLMPVVDVTLNMISLFAFIMVLGIVVDDAIVVGENIFSYRQQGINKIDAAIMGVRDMAAPVTMAVLTTMFAFAPLLLITGIMGKILRVIPLVVILVLAVSLVEALLILPAHLSAAKIEKKTSKNPLALLHRFVKNSLDKFINGPFAKFAMFTVKFRYATVAVGIAILMFTLGMIKGGIIKTTFFDPIEGDNMIAALTMPQGTPAVQTLEILKSIEDMAIKVRDEYDAEHPDSPSIYRHMSSVIGSQPGGDQGPVRPVSAGGSQAHLGEVNIELLGSEERQISAVELMNKWRELVGEVPGVSSLTFQSVIFEPGDAINVELTHRNFDQLVTAADELKMLLRNYNGVSDITDNFEPGKAEIKLDLTDTGRTLGLTLGDLARQVRQGFYGDEAQRIQRGKHDIRVMIRYPYDERSSLANVEKMRIRLPNGTEIPFSTVAKVQYGRGYATIRRADRKRVVNVTADVDLQNKDVNADEINKDLENIVLPELMTKYPGLNYRFAGEQRERNESFSSLYTAFPIALMAIYGLLAVQFRSYVQPLIVMSAIPFGIVGATFGHLLLGFNLGLLSFFGIVALSGVVVNDSLIMIDLINKERSGGIELDQVVRDSVTRRFRPIMLTTLTTFFGLIPMIMEKSIQARFLVPMAVSLAFGVMFATMITLVLVPSLYMVQEDAKNAFRWLLNIKPAQQNMTGTETV